MRRYHLLLVLSIMASHQASHAQLNIRTDQGDVSIGTNGINVRQGGQKVNINHNGISVNQPKRNVVIHPAVTTHVKTVSTVNVVRTGTVVGPSLDERVKNLEILAYGKQGTGKLIARVERLETDTLGAVGAGSLVVRVSKLATALGSSQSAAQKVVVKTSPNRESMPAVQVNSSASSVTVQHSGGAGKDISLDNSGFEGTVACDGGNVVLNASACKMRFTGPINALVLNGSTNNIICDSVHHVQVNGSANDVNWSRGCNPSVGNAGSANTLKSR